MRWVQALFVVEGFAGEDAVDLEEAAGVRVAEGGFHVPEAEADLVHLVDDAGHEGLALVEGDEGHFELDGDGAGEEVGGAGEDLMLEALDIEFEEGVAADGFVAEVVVETDFGDLLLLDVCGGGGGCEVGVEHGQDGTGVGVGGDVDLDFAGGVAEGHAVGDDPEGIAGGGLEEFIVGVLDGLEGDDFAAVAEGSAVKAELAGVGSDVEDEIDAEGGEEEARAEPFRGVDAVFADLQAGDLHGGEKVFFECLLH